jgi:predicted negative regulator of RcsB-dependent stress response
MLLANVLLIALLGHIGWRIWQDYKAENAGRDKRTPFL